MLRTSENSLVASEDIHHALAGVWLSWLSIIYATKRSPVRFQIRARARVAVFIPNRACAGGSPLMSLSHRCFYISFPPPSSL